MHDIPLKAIFFQPSEVTHPGGRIGSAYSRAPCQQGWWLQNAGELPHLGKQRQATVTKTRQTDISARCDIWHSTQSEFQILHPAITKSLHHSLKLFRWLTRFSSHTGPAF